MSTPEILWPALRQYRHNTDNSPDYLNPALGFVNAFDYEEVVKVVTAMQEEIAALREHLTSHIKQIGGLERIINMQAARVAALEKVAKLVLFYGTGHMDIRVALREAGYLKEEG